MNDPYVVFGTRFYRFGIGNASWLSDNQMLRACRIGCVYVRADNDNDNAIGPLAS